MSGIVGGINLRSSGLVNNSSATDGQVFTGTGAGLPAGFEAAAGGGKLLQVVQTHNITASTQTVGQDTITNLTGVNATITPNTTDSNILVMIRWAGEFEHVDIHNMSFGIHRDSTVIGNPSAASARRLGITHIAVGYWNSNADSTPDTVSYEYLDTGRSASTSAITYHATVIHNLASNYELHTNRTVGDADNDSTERLTSTITLLEIGA